MQDKLAQLEKKYGVDWREYELQEIFNHIQQGKRLKKSDQIVGDLPFVMAGRTNTGIVGYISNPERTFPANSITVDIFGNTFYRGYEFGAGDDTGVYWNDSVKFDRKVLQYISAVIEKSLLGKFDFGKKLRSSQSLEFKISLPTKNGEIAHEFMGEFGETLEAELLATLEAYLKATGLNNVALSAEEHSSLDKLGAGSVSWKVFNLEELFGKATRGRRLKSADRVAGNLPFVTAGEADMGISAFIGNDVQVFSENTVTIDMFGSAKYRNYKYGADDHVAVVHTEKLDKFSTLFTTSAIHKSAHAGQFDYSRNFYATDADELMISLPVSADGKIDFDFMSNLMSAMQKVVIKGVVEWVDKRIEVAKGVIENG